MALGHSASGTRNTRNWQYWLALLSGQRIQLDLADNFGVVNDTTTQILNRTDAALAASPAATWVVLGSTNDRGTLSAAQSIANLTAVRDKILAAGRRVIFIAETPRGDTTFTSLRFSGTLLSEHLQLRQWLLSQNNILPNVYAVDPWKRMAVASSTTGDAIVGKLYDGLHQAAGAGQDIANALLPVITNLYPAVDIVAASNSDQYDATNNPRGSLVANPMMTGTAGTASSGSTGQVADGWTFTPGGGLTLTCSKYTDPNGLEWQQLVASGTANANTFMRFFTNFSTSKVAAGDTLVVSGLVDLSGNAIGVRGLGVSVTCNGTTNVSVNDGAQGSEPIPNTAFAGPVTAKLVVPASPAYGDISVLLQVQSGIAYDFTLRTRAVSVRKLLP